MPDWEEAFLHEAVMVEKLYRSCFRCAVEDCRLTPNEIAVLLFLGRNAPGRDTATDIAQSCGISKALVARSVSGLHRRGFLDCERDRDDRRMVHLRLRGEGRAVAERLVQNGRRIAVELHRGIRPEELQLVRQIMQKMQGNLDALLEQLEG